MAQTKARLRVPGRMYWYAAPTGTAAPTSEVSALDPLYIELGYTSEDGSEFNYEPDIDYVRSHQSDYPTRTIFKGANATMKGELQEWSGYNFQRALGGGVVATVTAGHFKYSPSTTGVEAITLVAEVRDGTLIYRWVVPSCSPTDNLQIPLKKTEGAVLPVTWTVNGNDSGDPWYVLTNDVAFTPIP